MNPIELVYEAGARLVWAAFVTVCCAAIVAVAWFSYRASAGTFNPCAEGSPVTVHTKWVTMTKGCIREGNA